MMDPHSHNPEPGQSGDDPVPDSVSGKLSPAPGAPLQNDPENLSEASFGRLLSSTWLVADIKKAVGESSPLEPPFPQRLERVGKISDPALAIEERETVIYALTWVMTDALDVLDEHCSSDEMLMSIAEFGAEAVRAFSDRPLLGTPQLVAGFFEQFFSFIDLLQAAVPAEPALAPRFSAMMEVLGEGFSSPHLFQLAPRTKEEFESQDYVHGALGDIIGARLGEVSSFDHQRAFPSQYTREEIGVLQDFVRLATCAGVLDIRGASHALFVKIFNWYVQNVPDLGQLGAELLPDPLSVATAAAWQDPDSDDSDAPWRSSLDEEGESEESPETAIFVESEEFEGGIDDDFGPMMVLPDMDTKRLLVPALNELFLSVIDLFRATLSSHVNEQRSQAIREDLHTLIHDLGPEWFAWTPVLAAYASHSGYALEEARIPLEDKLIRPLVQGKSHLIHDLYDFIRGGRDMLELAALVIRDLPGRQQRTILNLLKEEAETCAALVSEEEGGRLNETADALEKALRPSRSRYFNQAPEENRE